MNYLVTYHNKKCSKVKNWKPHKPENKVLCKSKKAVRDLFKKNGDSSVKFYINWHIRGKNFMFYNGKFDYLEYLRD